MHARYNKAKQAFVCHMAQARARAKAQAVTHNTGAAKCLPYMRF